MTMTDNSPPPSPNCVKPDGDEEAQLLMTAPSSINREGHPTLPPYAVNRHLYYTFPTPPHSPSTPPSVPRTMHSPRTTPSPSRRHTRTTSRSIPHHTRRQSSLSTSSFHASQIIEEQYGPPPHPAPTTPIPPIPGAPRVPYTTPQQERNRYSSCELFDNLRLVDNEEHVVDARTKRHSAPMVTSRSYMSPTTTARPDFYDLRSRRAAAMYIAAGEDIRRGIEGYENTGSQEKEL
jgi:hypothetical protein